MNPLNVRKEMENCLPSAFQFWANPEFRKILDEKIVSLVYGGNSLKESNNEHTKQGLIPMQLVIVRLIEHINECEHIREYFQKKTLWILSLKN